MHQVYQSADDFIRHHKPEIPVRCCRPFAVKRSVEWFKDNFDGRLVYALKANDADYVIEALCDAGIDRFDVASLAEIRRLHLVAPEARALFMNPVKPSSAIAAAYHEHGVRCFALDHPQELEKILNATSFAKDLCLVVRLACNDDGSVLPLSKKYGIGGSAAVNLLKTARAQADRLGVTFHVGSQALEPARFGEAILQTAALVRGAGVEVDLLNVGGGFPVDYGGGEPIDRGAYMDVIHAHLNAAPLGANVECFAEPGRAIAANAESLIVQVDARRECDLYINDGGYGVLFDAAHSGWRFPVRLLGKSGEQVGALTDFRLWGPSCDADDVMEGPFQLPDTVSVGDYIEIGLTGAYGAVMAAGFNGFGRYEMIEVEDDPFAAQVDRTLCEYERVALV